MYLLLFLSDIQHVIGIDKFDLNLHMQQQKQYVQQGNLITFGPCC